MMPLDQTDLTIIDGAARVNCRKLSDALGFAKVGNLHRLIKARWDELEDFGEVFLSEEKNPAGGRPTLNYYLNEQQATALCLWAETDKARAARRLIIEVFTAWRQGRLDAAHTPDAMVPPAGNVIVSEDRYIGLLGRHIDLLEAERNSLCEALDAAWQDRNFWLERWKAHNDKSRRDLDASLRARVEVRRGWPVSATEARGIAALFNADFSTSEVSEITQRSECTVRRYRAGGDA